MSDIKDKDIEELDEIIRMAKEQKALLYKLKGIPIDISTNLIDKVKVAIDQYIEDRNMACLYSEIDTVVDKSVIKLVDMDTNEGIIIRIMDLEY